jgi:hypothetical protein
VGLSGSVCWICLQNRFMTLNGNLVRYYDKEDMQVGCGGERSAHAPCQ